MATDREKEREAELESAMYTNCLLLGLDPAVLGSPAGAAAPRVGEQLLYFLLSSLRGPAQSAKDFDKVWPIFDSAQSREFRKNLMLQGNIGYKVSDLKSCILTIHELQLSRKCPDLTAIRNKYKDRKFGCVSAMASPEEIPASFLKDLIK